MPNTQVATADPFQIIAVPGQPREPTRVLKDGESFAVFDEHGDVTPGGLGEQGLYHLGTRHLSRLSVGLFGRRPLLLGSSVREQNDLLAIDLTNADVPAREGGPIRRELLHVYRAVTLVEGQCRQVLRFSNYAAFDLVIPVTVLFDADFADVFEVRGMTRARRGHLVPPKWSGNSVLMRYVGLDQVVRETRLHFSLAPVSADGGSAAFEVCVKPDEVHELAILVECLHGQEETRPFAIPGHTRSQGGRRGGVDITSGYEPFDAWVRRSRADLVMMTSKTGAGRYPYAGVPWFSAPFGRDGLITALQMLWLDPDLAKGVLAFLADTQARTLDPSRDAEPGKILHEMRHGEMAALGEIPFGRYYGSVDATPLFVLLAGEYLARTGDVEFLRLLSPAVEAALGWMSGPGDPDGDGFIEYDRHSGDGLVQQGWKDSQDSVFHENGGLAEAPIALCEVQAYAHGAWLGAAGIAEALGHPKRAAEHRDRADRLRARFNDAFWLPDLSVYALALDRDKRPCRVVSSNAGQCLFTGICPTDRGELVAQRLADDSSFSGWGIRTIASAQRGYNPMSYHNGSIWPHDNALIALGFSRVGRTSLAARVLDAMLDCADAMPLRRLPELLCGFHRREGEGPTLYPVACAPQAWASGAVFMLLQAVLGLSVDGARGEVHFKGAHLPARIHNLHLRGLSVGRSEVDLTITARTEGVSVHVDRGEAKVVVAS